MVTLDCYDAMLMAVALLTEGVDRNAHILFARHLAAVALLTEGVDRNVLCSCVP